MTDSVDRVLADAAAAVEAAGLPDDLRQVAFSKAVDLISGATSPPTVVPTASRRAAAGGATGWLESVAVATSRSPEELESIYFADDDGEPLVGVNPARLGDTAAARARSVLLLLACARQVGGIEEKTESKILRDECKRLGVYDQANFGSTMSELKDWFNITGERLAKVVRVKPAGRDAFRRTLAELVDDDAE